MPSKTSADLFIHPIGELATPVVVDGPARGKEMGDVIRLKNAAVAVTDGKITAAGSYDDVMSTVEVNSDTKVIDAASRLATPGLVDAHTHLVFAGNRANEFTMRCQGKSYTEIAEAGGGIVASTAPTRNASVSDLVRIGKLRLGRMLEAGTTTCEVKTGYGLDKESELKMLEAIYRLMSIQPVELVPTFLPAHAIPKECNRDDYVKSVIEDMLPAAHELVKSLNGSSFPYNDVFCDQGYFTLEETRKILEAGLKYGFKPKVHADEFANLGATRLAVELKASSSDHLLKISDEEIDLLAGSDTIAVLLPGTSFYLNLTEHAPARKLIDRGAAVALGSDFNPGSCHIFSLPLIWGLACLHLGMTPEEALTALTVNAACSIDRSDKIGQISPGYQADIVLFDVESLEEIPYNLGWNPVYMSVKKGQIVWQRGG